MTGRGARCSRSFPSLQDGGPQCEGQIERSPAFSGQLLMMLSVDGFWKYLRSTCGGHCLGRLHLDTHIVYVDILQAASHPKSAWVGLIDGIRSPTGRAPSTATCLLTAGVFHTR